MATPSQIAANRENAKKSTGPVTPEGKAKSSRNALSHGFESSTFFIQDENEEEFHALMQDLQNEYQPATPTEQILVEKMFHHQLLSLRAIRLQSDCLLGVTFGDAIPKDLGLLIRYQTAADRGFHRAHAELVKAQKERKTSEIGFVPEKPDEASVIPDETPENRASSSENQPAQPVAAAVNEVLEPQITSDPAELPQAA